MTDEIAPAGIPETLEADLKRSEQSARRLLENLARKLGATTEYVKTHSARDIVETVRRAALTRPVYALVAAAAAGFALGCVVRRSTR
jgi:hypothetical protein